VWIGVAGGVVLGGVFGCERVHVVGGLSLGAGVGGGVEVKIL